VSSGNAAVAPKSGLDLDGRPGQTGNNDVVYQADTSVVSVAPQNGAKLGNVGIVDFEGVNMAQLKTAAVGTQPINGFGQLRADAIVIAMPNWNPGGVGGVYDPHSIGVWFTGQGWSVFNQDRAAMTPNMCFNILPLAPGDTAFVHRAIPPGFRWGAFERLGAPPGGFLGAPATVSRSPGICNVYVRGADNALWQKPFLNGQWGSGFTRHNDGGVLSSPPACGSMGPNHEHVFVRGTDGQVWQKWWFAASGWSQWVPHGAPPGGFRGGPAIISRNGSVCNIYVWGNDNGLWQRAFYNNQWFAWAKHPDGVLTSVPGLASQGPNHEEVFVRGTDGQVFHKWWVDGTGWSAWFPLGAPPGGFQGAPSAIWRGTAGASLFVWGADHALWELPYDAGAWRAWQRHDSGLSAEPAAGSMTAGTEQVFVRGNDGQAYRQVSSPTGNISGHVTFIDHPKTNGNPNANPSAVLNWNPGGSGGVFNPHHIGVWYNGSKWSVFNQDIQPMPPGAAFNIHLPSGSNAFIHEANASNISAHVTVINHPLANGKPDAILFVTPLWRQVYVNHPIGVYYNGANWAIFHQDMQAMPVNSLFNVEIYSPSDSAFVHRASATNIAAHSTAITRFADAGNQLAKGDVFAVATKAGNYAKVHVADVTDKLSVEWVTYTEEPRYQESAPALDDLGARNPFVFPRDLYGYVFKGIGNVSGDKGGLIRQTVAWNGVPNVYFQDETRQNVFYYLPDAFKIARVPGPLRHPFFSVSFSSPDGSLEKTSAVVEYFAAPFISQARVSAAVDALRQFVPSGAGDPSLELLIANQLQFRLGLTRPDNPAVSFVDCPEALVSLRDGIHHSRTFTMQEFQGVFDALFSSTSSLFQGQVQVMLGDSGGDVPPIPLIARMNDLAGSVFDVTTGPGTADDRIAVTLKNVIESPVTLHQLDGDVRRGSAHADAVAQGLTLPADIAPGASLAFEVAPASPLAGNGPLEVTFDFEHVEVKTDRDAIWDSVLNQTVTPDYVRPIRVRTVKELFDPPAAGDQPPIGLIVVELKRGESRSTTVELSMQTLEMEAKLRAPLKDYVLGKVDEGTYSYKVTPVRGGTQPPDRPWKTASTDLLLILSQDVS
jgi:hypothetical protein